MLSKSDPHAYTAIELPREIDEALARILTFVIDAGHCTSPGERWLLRISDVVDDGFMLGDWTITVTRDRMPET